MALAVAATLGGCGSSSPPDRSSRAATSASAPQHRSLAAARGRTRRLRDRLRATRAAVAPQGSIFTAADRSSFTTLAARLGGSSGIAVAPVGRRTAVDELGALRAGPAWSTIKTAIAATVLGRGGGRPGTQGLLRRAITESDNAAAQALWSSLGAPAAAGAAVARTLAAAGDTATSVETRVLRPGFSSFGQTSWSLAGQARFTAGLPCLASGRPVLALMGEVVSGQRWGLGSSGLPARFKGGWGPDPRGRYLVRQLGVLTLPDDRTVAVTLASMPADGSFATGTQDLTELARWVAPRIARRGIRGGGC